MKLSTLTALLTLLSTLASAAIALSPASAAATSRVLWTQNGSGTMNTTTWKLERTGQAIYSTADPAVSGDPVKEVGFDGLVLDELSNAVPSADGSKIYWAFKTGTDSIVAETTPQSGVAPILQLVFHTRYINKVAQSSGQGFASRVQVDEQHGYIYWSQCYSGCSLFRKPLSATEFDSNSELLYTSSNEIRGFSIDTTRCKLFWAENSKVYGAPCDGSASKTQLYESEAASGAFNPPTVSGVAVDPGSQKIFFTSWKSAAFTMPGDPPGAVVNSRVWVGNESGSAAQAVLYEDGSNNLTAPALGENGRIYWGDPGFPNRTTNFKQVDGWVRAGWTDGHGTPETLYSGIGDLVDVGTAGAGATAPEPPAAPTGFGTKPDSVSSDVNPSISVTGSGPDGSTLQCKLDAGTWAACSSPVALTSLNGGNPLSEGDHTFSARYVSSEGTEGTAADYTWTIDTTAPDAPGVAGTPTSGTQSSTASLTLTGEEGATFECSLNDGPWAACTSPYSLTGLPDGPVSVKVRQKDAAGNAGADTEVTWVIGDATPTPPSGPVSLRATGGTIVEGVRTFNRSKVAFNSVWPIGARQIEVSNLHSFRKSTTFAVGTTLTWNLPNPRVGTTGTSTIYYRFIGDRRVDTSVIRSKTVSWDLAAPYLRMAARSRALGYSADAWKVRLSGGDVGTGLRTAQFWTKKTGRPTTAPLSTGPGFVAPFANIVTVPGSAAPLWVRVRDQVGNWSRWYVIR